LTPSFQHCLSPSNSSGLISDRNGWGSALFACFLAALQLLLCFVPHQPPKSHILPSTRPIDPIFSAFFISIYQFLFAMETAVEVLYLLGF
jgi:hypothetical protein